MAPSCKKNVQYDLVYVIYRYARRGSRWMDPSEGKGRPASDKTLPFAVRNHARPHTLVVQSQHRTRDQGVEGTREESREDRLEVAACILPRTLPIGCCHGVFPQAANRLLAGFCNLPLRLNPGALCCFRMSLLDMGDRDLCHSTSG